MTRMLLLRSEWSSNSSSVVSFLRKYPSRDPFLGYLSALLGELVDPKSLDRERKARKSGRMVAMDDAVMPMPGSTVDQIETSVLAHRKSWVAVNLWINGNRTMLAVEPLQAVSS